MNFCYLSHLYNLVNLRGSSSSSRSPSKSLTHNHHSHHHQTFSSSSIVQLVVFLNVFITLCCPIGLAQGAGLGATQHTSNSDNHDYKNNNVNPNTRNIHHSMDVSDLRRVFQVESHDKVPEYDLVHVRVLPKREAPTSSSSSSPSSASSTTTTTTTKTTTKQTKSSSSSPSTLSTSTSSPLSNNSPSQSSSNLPPTRRKTKSSNKNSNGDSKRIQLKVFGQDYDLNLHPNSDFSERIKDMKVFIAETKPNGKLSYQEDATLKESPELGKPYHDHLNMAAVLVSHDPEGRLQMDGTLGNSLVIKPIPEKLSSKLSETFYGDYNRDDDEMFLDDDEADEAFHNGNNNNKQNQQSNQINTNYMKNSYNNTNSSPNGDDSLLFKSSSLNQLNNNNVTTWISKYSPYYRIPKTTSSSSTNNNTKNRKRKSLYAHKNAHIVYKKARHEPESHSDYLELEPGLSLLSLNASQLRSSSSSSKVSNEPSLSTASSLSSSTSSSFNTSNDNGNHHHRSKRQAPDTVWPEVLLVVDYDSYILHGANSRDVKRYFISFWNGVDLRYKLLSHPTIRVSLAGMIVAKDRDATPYLERNRLRPPNADAVDAAGALTDMGKYLYREDRLPTYDLAVVITKLDMCRRRYEGGRCNRGTAGFAYVGGACVVNKRLEKVNSVAIIEDSGGFSGIIVAAHEVGHLLGCVHDGSPPPSYLGGPGATRCPWEDGFIMSDLRHTERGFRWSSCSVEQFKHFLNGETATCLYNYPHENQLLPRVLPGTMLTLDEQCKRDRGTNACFKDARVCAQLFCFDSASGYCVSYRPAAEGSPCGDGQVCRNGKCTAELENIIPDYTHVTQTISRSPNSRANGNSNNDNSVPTISRRSSAGRPRSRSNFVNQRSSSTSSIDGSSDVSSPGVNLPTQSSSSSPNLDNLSPGSPDCQDNVEKIGGSMSCAQFLEKYSYRYCNHNYVKRHCCASHALLCNPE
ncbi:uncharacterized protein LOC128394963 [Panonychus citri]|uniref:uncharacterized protein LOC128394963 n=1 Tax=Panonychus citri TaxID=50023 RepID=UPI002307E377|nr:uncharacterized protein LOC128394963 [Panonychus citri]XP_053211316.1 uncharacterized protein LOC128394963 [Panonychus citri]XP_053211317.1 uncharacterized protein LOC128394963 [Panonychus citri]XP_053211318.1 uncharacterized protein LOC128394963 [Panonychus citri]